MFEISELKAKKLTDLQEIAKTIGLTKISQSKKLDLVYQILDKQASEPSATKKTTSIEEKPKSEKPKRKRVVKKANTPPAKEDLTVNETKPVVKAEKTDVKKVIKKEVTNASKAELEKKVEGDSETKEQKPINKSQPRNNNQTRNNNNNSQHKNKNQHGHL